MELYWYKFKVTKVYDGDTVYGIADMGFGTFKGNEKSPLKIRLKGINAPEIRTRDLEQKKRGYAARDFLKELLETSGEIYLNTLKKGKYGRWVGDLVTEQWNGTVSEILVSEGHAEWRDY